MAFNFIANTASIMSIASSAIEAGELGARNASQAARTAVAIKDIKDYTGDSMLNKSSEKHNAMKEIVRNGDFFTGFYKAGGAISGFFKGLWDGMKGNFLSTGFAAMTLAFKNKTVKTVGLIGMAGSMLYDFVKNGTNLFTKKDIIEK